MKPSVASEAARSPAAFCASRSGKRCTVVAPDPRTTLPAVVLPCAAVRFLALLLAAGCAGIPLPQDAAAPDLAPGSVELDACIVWGERHDRRMYEGVSELSFAPWHQAIATVVLKHPAKGIVLVDPAFGLDVAEDLRRVPPWFTIISGGAKTKTPAVTGLREAGIDARDVKEVLLTHAHWDHAGGLRDLPVARVQLAKAEYDHVASLERYLEHGVMRHHFVKSWPRTTPFELDGPPVLRFEASHDVFGDGSVTAVALPGHTPGSVGYLLRGRGGKRWLLTGDSTWTLRGVEKPAHKLVRLIDLDGKQTGESIGRLHVLLKEHPEIAILPAHDGAALEALPTCVR